ncbi:nucleotidyl transferase AbiEii/AbiGii toxin family protein [Chitinophaga oryzae]|uniref:Nucleotidyl transferase AbiEii/AbiGii toxin family protein n=1 Tax=Chitinophaga oryzae TaxID=2725414 RepID=A0AAE7DAB6_9BACT|nr:nucleotidyl transferase AbiEii/AbiGii toxin family protein [Chitinophaga oryzae]QJB35147.1 nucleotidyl transferase AbiEii/AbiGii toxin family protein [Chitinophaga oryzae]QJB41664.1 nucleotidyl transferase AbiEii/AbiGii toxin family protein [Chitinophaga oryzae]
MDKKGGAPEAGRPQEIKTRPLLPRVTLLEKALLVNEVFIKSRTISVKRKSRHFYDMLKMDRAGVVDEALADNVLYTTIQKHRKHYSRLKYMGTYTSLDRNEISFIPPAHMLDMYQHDYQYMTTHMLHGEIPDFAVVPDGLATILEKFRNTTWFYSFPAPPTLRKNHNKM